ncbi:Ig-like domain repeat protein [Spirillospora sp. NPDC049652]
MLVAAACVAGGQAVAQRPASAAPPTDLALGTGYNRYGQIGDGTTTDRHAPVPVALPAGVTVTQISAGQHHSLALTSDGRVLAWGRNNYGQLGDGTATQRTIPIEVHLPSGVTVSQISAGHTHSLALTSDGRVLAWGQNNVGQLGDGTTTNRYSPVDVHLPPGAIVTQVSGGSQHSLARTSDGRALAWGNNNSGQLGDETTTHRHSPVEVHLPPGAAVEQLSAGSSFSLAVTADGRALGWGSNTFGRLGDGTTTARHSPVYAHLPSGVAVTQIDGGVEHSLAVTSDGRALGWGSNVQGMLGDGTTTTRHSPIYVHLPSDVTITQISAGWGHSMAVASNGRAFAWGYNGYGRLGDGTTVDRHTPVLVALPAYTVATAVDAGSYHSLLLAEPYGSRTSLTAEPTHAAPGREVTLTATVTCAFGDPAGTVTFVDDDDRVIGTAEIDAAGVATLNTTGLDEGEHHITAHYEGDAVCPPSTSNTVRVTISPEPAPGVASLHLSKEFDSFVKPQGGHKMTHKHGRHGHRDHARGARMTLAAWHDHDAIRYRFVVTNDGDVPIDAITIHDSLIGTITCSSHTVEPGQSVTCHGVHKVTGEEKSRGYVDNTATATGTRQDDGETVTSNEARLRVDITYA